MIDKVSLKYKLLQTNYVIDNSYLDKYISLVLNPSISNIDYTETHHILPKNYYKVANLAVDNSVDNLVNLSYSEHIKAHLLLYFCTIGRVKIANAQAVAFMFDKFSLKRIPLDKITTKDLKNLQQKVNNIISNKINKFWTPEEDLLIKTNYTKFGHAYCCKLLKNRSSNAIRTRAWKLGVCCNSIWSDDEVNILITNYSKFGLNYCCTLLPGRTKATIKTMASYLGLKSRKQISWTVDEDRIICKNYLCNGVDYCKQLLINRSKSAIYDRAIKTWHLNKFSATAITDEFIEKLIIDNSAVYSTASNRWSVTDIQLIKQYYVALGPYGCQKLLSTPKTITSIKKRASMLGIRYKGATK